MKRDICSEITSWDEMSSHQRQEQEALFSSQSSVPVVKDNCNYLERQRKIWDEMHQRMEMRRKEWDDDVMKLKQDFFRLKPDDFTTAPSVTGEPWGCTWMGALRVYVVVFNAILMIFYRFCIPHAHFQSF